MYDDEAVEELHSCIDALKEENTRLREENNRLENRDCNASIELVYNDGENPFARERLSVVDVGVSDNCYIVESEVLQKLQKEIERLRELVRVAYVEGVSDTFDFGVTNGYQGWDDSHAKKEMDGENK